MNKPNVSIKIIFNSKIVKSITSRKMRRINKFIEANNFQNCLYKVQIFYGNNIDNRKNYKTKLVSNKGDYKTKKDLIEGLRAFLEKDIY